MSGIEFKADIHNQCLAIIDNKLKTISEEFKLYQDSAANETKSTAGDKHDTAKAMMQMEQEKLGNQLKELLNSKNILLSINYRQKFEIVSGGSFIVTNYGKFYFSISLGKIIVEQQEILAISIQSPLGKLLAGKRLNDAVEFNGRKYQIEEIY